MRRARVGATLLCALLSALQLAAQAEAPALEEPLTIERAVEVALANHPSLASSWSGVQAAQAAVLQARSGLRPSVGLSAGYTRSGGGTTGGGAVGGGGSADQYSTSVGVDQLLFDSGRTRDGIRESRLSAQAAEQRHAQAEADVANNARQAFLVLVASQELLEVARYSVRLQQDTLDMVQAEFDEGTVPGADVAKASAALASARVDVTDSQNAVAQAQVALNETMGIDVRTQYEVVVPQLADLPELTADELLTVALESRPELLAARTDIGAAEAALSAARKGQKPGLTADGSYGTRDGSFFPTQDSWSVGLSVSMNLTDGGATKAQTRHARAQLESAQSDARNTAQQVSAEVVSALLDLQTARERIVAAETTVASATEDHDLALGRYRANVGILLEVLDAETSLTSAQADLARARFSLLSAYHALGRAVGVPVADVPAAAGDETVPTEAPGDQA